MTKKSNNARKKPKGVYIWREPWHEEFINLCLTGYTNKEAFKRTYPYDEVKDDKTINRRADTLFKSYKPFYDDLLERYKKKNMKRYERSIEKAIDDLNLLLDKLRDEVNKGQLTAPIINGYLKTIEQLAKYTFDRVDFDINMSIKQAELEKIKRSLDTGDSDVVEGLKQLSNAISLIGKER